MEKLISKYQLGDIVYRNTPIRTAKDYVVAQITYAGKTTDHNLYTIYDRNFDCYTNNVEESELYSTQEQAIEAYNTEVDKMKNEFKLLMPDISSLVQFCVKSITYVTCENTAKRETILEKAKEFGISVD